MKFPKYNRDRDVCIDITEGILLISVNGISICKQPVNKMSDAELLGFIYGVLCRNGVLE